LRVRRNEAIAANVVDMPEERVDIDSATESEAGQHDGRPRFGELLVQSQVITPAQLAEALMRQSGSGKRIGGLLVELGVINERDLAATLSRQLGVALADLRAEAPDQEALALLPESVVRAHVALPLRLDDGVLHIVVADPSAQLGQLLGEAAGCGVRLLVAPRTDVQRTIDQSYRATVDLGQLVRAFEVAESTRKATPTDEEAQNDDAPVVRVVHSILTQALRDRASDVHIEPQDKDLRVRFRIDGALHDALSLPMTMAPALISRLKIMAGLNIVERRRSQDGQIAIDIDGRPVDIRIATTAVIWGEKCVLRILDKSRSVYKLGSLGMPPETHDTYSRLIRAPFGMVLCAGPTGSGKTTTLYASLTEVNDPTRNIMTIEDPVEYVFPSINQIQTNEQAGLTFANGLRSILRQDPDVILVGEIRDVETARIAVQSALTGHFVLSSLHATDAVAALHRFLDMGIESFLIASSVLAVVGQRLVRRICTSCTVEYTPSDEEMLFYEEGGGPPKGKFFKGKGCNLCAETGYQNRIGVYEFLPITPQIKRLVVGWATQEELRRLATSQGMRSLRDEALSLVEQDITTIAEVIRSVYAV
jgi:type IV pilus assembly protein PilB